MGSNPIIGILDNAIYFLFALGLIRSCLATNQKKLLPVRSATYWTEEELFLLNRNERQVVFFNDAVAYSLTAPGVTSRRS